MKTLRRSSCAVLPLVLRREWYDMIASGAKREEYRVYKPYWKTRIGRWSSRKADNFVVTFSRGYRKPGMAFNVSTILYRDHFAYHTDWGEPVTPHYVIVLGERVNLEGAP